MTSVAIIIVTHNSQDVLPRCVQALQQQRIRTEIIIVDSGSEDVAYLETYREFSGIETILKENIGFSRANNAGWQAVSQTVEFVLFLNPDAFVTENALQKALEVLKKNEKIGCVGARLLGFDKNGGVSTNLLDSTGVFRKWYGCWYDRNQGEKDTGQYSTPEDVPALCGAFLFCRQALLVQLAQNSEDSASVFDPDFFLYKEDIELCLRIRKLGWRIVYDPEITVYHCRGWQKNRRNIPCRQRLIAAKSEVLLYRKHPSLYILWALLKYGLVRLLKI
ncbi:MAG: glycosyltransferase family 2 protein [Candidatus Electrothrix sp. AUS1_2]|nr:glycosyltransferase family 2 protein [Candidatus Electrothrix sp. AUS1_2]